MILFVKILFLKTQDGLSVRVPEGSSFQSTFFSLTTGPVLQMSTTPQHYTIYCSTTVLSTPSKKQTYGGRTEPSGTFFVCQN